MSVIPLTLPLHTEIYVEQICLKVFSNVIIFFFLEKSMLIFWSVHPYGQMKDSNTKFTRPTSPFLLEKSAPRKEDIDGCKHD